MTKDEIQKAWDDLNAKYLDALYKLQHAYKLLEQKPKVVEKKSESSLRDIAKILAGSELNKEDLSEEEIFELLQKDSEEEVKRKIGFWAMPLPSSDELGSNQVWDDPNSDVDDKMHTVYIGKK